MALVLIATPKAINANTYILSVDSNTYFEARVSGSSWEDIDDEIRATALVHATRVLDYSYDWNGYKTNNDQALDWPRENVWDKNDLLLDENTIPTKVKEAICELAYFLTTEDKFAEPESKGIREMKAGSLNIIFDKRDPKEVLPANVLDMLWDYGELMGAGGGGMKSVYRS